MSKMMCQQLLASCNLTLVIVGVHLSTYIVLKVGVYVCLHFYLVYTASLQLRGWSLCPV